MTTVSVVSGYRSVANIAIRRVDPHPTDVASVARLDSNTAILVHVDVTSDVSRTIYIDVAVYIAVDVSVAVEVQASDGPGRGRGSISSEHSGGLATRRGVVPSGSGPLNGTLHARCPPHSLTGSARAVVTRCCSLYGTGYLGVSAGATVRRASSLSSGRCH